MIRIIFSGVDVLELSRNWCLESLCNLKSEAEKINQYKIFHKPAQFHTPYPAVAYMRLQWIGLCTHADTSGFNLDC